MGGLGSHLTYLEFTKCLNYSNITIILFKIKHLFYTIETTSCINSYSYVSKKCFNKFSENFGRGFEPLTPCPFVCDRLSPTIHGVHVSDQRILSLDLTHMQNNTARIGRLNSSYNKLLNYIYFPMDLYVLTISSSR